MMSRCRVEELERREEEERRQREELSEERDSLRQDLATAEIKYTDLEQTLASKGKARLESDNTTCIYMSAIVPYVPYTEN